VRKFGLRRALTGPRRIITAVLVTLAAVGLVVAPVASAAPSTDSISDLAFIRMLKNEGLLTGAAHTLFKSTGRNETPDLHTAQIMVDAAANTLCLYAGTSRPHPRPGLLL
jgi:hypothetical protein